MLPDSPAPALNYLEKHRRSTMLPDSPAPALNS
jgi:hypothetical protein